MVTPRTKYIMTERKTMLRPSRMALSSPALRAVTVFLLSRTSYPRIVW